MNKFSPSGARRPRLLMIELFAQGGLLHYSWQLAMALAAQLPAGERLVFATARRPECGPAPARLPGLELRTPLWTWNPRRPPRLAPRRLVRAWHGLVYLAVWLQIAWLTERMRPEIVLLGDLEHRPDAWFVRWLGWRGRRRGWRMADIWHNVAPFERNLADGVVRELPWRNHMARKFDRVFVHGQALARQFEQATGARATVIAHGNQDWLVEQAGPDPGLDQRLGLEPGPAVALLLGTLSAYKGVEVALAALALVPASRRPQLLIAGLPAANVRPDAWREQARQLGIAPWVHWDLGHVPTPEVAWYVRRADFVVLPYRAASQSGIAHLALTLGKPLIVSAAGSLPELIDGNGLVVAANDAADLAQALAQLANDAGLRRRMAERSRHLARSRHDWGQVARAVWTGLPTPPRAAATAVRLDPGARSPAPNWPGGGAAEGPGTDTHP